MCSCSHSYQNPQDSENQYSTYYEANDPYQGDGQNNGCYIEDFGSSLAVAIAFVLGLLFLFSLLEGLMCPSQHSIFSDTGESYPGE